MDLKQHQARTVQYSNTACTVLASSLQQMTGRPADPSPLAGPGGTTMKTLIAFVVTLMLAAVSASALAMPCGKASKSSGEALDSQHLMPLHVAQQGQVALKRPARLPKLAG